MAQVTSFRPLALAIAGVLACSAPTLAAVAQDAVAYQPALDAGWAGRYAEALQMIDAYLAAHPQDHAAQLDRARFLAWSGDYPAAIDTLDRIPAGTAVDTEAIALRARVLAWAGRRDAAEAINAPLYADNPEDYDAAWTQALILRQSQWPQQALPALATVQAVKPDEQDTIDLVKTVRLPLYSSVALPVSVYSDSDDIEIRTAGLEANVWLSDRWHLLASATRREHSAAFGGAFAPLAGDNSVDEDRIGAGLRFAPSRDTALEFWLGRSSIDNGLGSDGESIGHLQWSQRASDAFSYALTYERDRVDASPRALAVMRNGLAADLTWAPTLRDTFVARIAHDNFDDDNRRLSVLASYNRGIYRGARASIDIGGVAEGQHNSRNTDNGYYAPDRYRRFAPQISSYIGLGQEAGLYLSAAVGVQKDETFDSWKRATDVGAELTVGIFSHWQLVGRAGYSQRLNQFGRYEGTTVGLELRYRFCEFRADRCPR